jgi:hypothetical protein
MSLVFESGLGDQLYQLLFSLVPPDKVLDICVGVVMLNKARKKERKDQGTYICLFVPSIMLLF